MYFSDGKLSLVTVTPFWLEIEVFAAANVGISGDRNFTPLADSPGS
jgi:hypothetical protein